MELEGSYPDAFKEFVKDKDRQLMGLQNRLIATSDNLSFLNELNLLSPTPLDALRYWSSHSGAMLAEVVGRQAAVEILDEEESPHVKGKKSSKDTLVSQQIYDEVIRAMGPKKKLVAGMGSILMGKNFELPLIPLNLKVDKKKTADMAAEAKKPQGRQRGPMAKPAAVETGRVSTRGQKVPKPPAPPAWSQPAKANKSNNTSANGAAKTVQGGSTLPSNSHVVPEHLQHLQQFRSPASSRSGVSADSLSSHAITELGKSVAEAVGSKLDQLSSQQTEASAAEIAKLQTENEKLREALQKVTCELAAKDATLTEVRRNKEEQSQMHSQWTAMCNSMLGTIERTGR